MEMLAEKIVNSSIEKYISTNWGYRLRLIVLDTNFNDCNDNFVLIVSSQVARSNFTTKIHLS